MDVLEQSAAYRKCRQMDFFSTRGAAQPRKITELFSKGLAEDGGLFTPTQWPSLAGANLSALKNASYPELCWSILSQFITAPEDREFYRSSILDSFDQFGKDPSPKLTLVGGKIWSLELFNTPTLAFKDYALFPLARLIVRALQKRKDQATILCATSGDTGASTAAAFAGMENCRAVILFPRGRVSEVQRMQITRTGAANIIPIEIDGDFDDCQRLVKEAFKLKRRTKNKLVSVNSINIVRLVLQSTYYFQAAMRLEGKGEAVNFIVPTGNMGNLFSAYIAKLMGAPIGKMIASSNENDTVPRLFSDQILRPEKTKATLSPSMDIQIPSNLERLIWWNKDKDAVGTQSVYRKLEADGQFSFRKPEMERLMKQFSAFRCSERNALETMRFHRASTKRYICPHSATAFAVADRVKSELNGPIVCVETAHAAKFPEASQRAFSSPTALPIGLQRLTANEEVFKTANANLEDVVRQFSY